MKVLYYFLISIVKIIYFGIHLDLRIFFYYNKYMVKFKKFKQKIILVVVLIVFGLLIVSCTNNSDTNLLNTNCPLGVWWWDYNLTEEYLQFASKNGVNEIYYCNSNKFNQENADFIITANQLDIDVYWLCGDYKWIENKNDFYEAMAKFEKFQNDYSNIYKGLHLDVEPHQLPNWKSDRENIIINYIDFIKTITEKYNNICFDFDIPFWLEDIVTYDGQTKEAFKFVFDYADRVFIMSYRDNAEKMVEVAKQELEYAKENNKSIFLSAETGKEEDIVTFFEEGKKYMYSQINQLEKLVDQPFGFSIHHIKSWYNLKN